jgi:hypothetical protein
MDGWRYYNHAMIPTIPPHESVNTACVEDKSIWKENKSALPDGRPILIAGMKLIGGTLLRIPPLTYPL